MALAAAVAVAFSASAIGQAVSQGDVIVAIDVDVTGNDARTVGAIDNCARIDSSGTNKLAIDVVLPNPGIPADVGMKAWQFDLLYDASVVTVLDHDPEMLLAQAEGSDLLAALSDQLPESDGSFTSATVEFGTPIGIEPTGVHEAGPGVIARITLAGVSTGTTDLTLSNIILVDAKDTAIPLSSVLNATVSVDTSCTPPPPTTAPGSQEPLPDTPGAGEPVETGVVLPAEGVDATETQLVVTDPTPFSVGDFIQMGDEIMEVTAIDGNTLTVTRCVRGTTCTLHTTDDPILLLEDETGGTPDADTQADGPPATGVDTETPGPGTPVLGGTPVTGDEAGAGGEATDAGESDGGLSAGAWAGIGAAIAAAAVAASAAGWFALRRRRARGTPTSGGEGGSE